jgi:hypothetical protein
MTAQIVQLPLPGKPAKQVYHVTDALAKKLPVPPTGNKVYFDDTTPGFGVRVTAAGARSYVFGYQTKAGRKRMLTIGDIDNWRAAAARDEARAHKRIVQQGGDPHGDLAAMRDALTVGELCNRFIKEHASRKRTSTASDYELIIETPCAARSRYIQSRSGDFCRLRQPAPQTHQGRHALHGEPHHRGAVESI